MKHVGGVWLPDRKTSIVEWMQTRNQIVDGKLTYQFDKLSAALTWVKNWRVAVDVGAHCGLWSMHLAKRFREVHAFEPVAEHRWCFGANVERDEESGVFLWDCALGERDTHVAMNVDPTASGEASVGGPGDIAMRRLDDFELRDVDFIKLDCEGYELFALQGAEATLRRCRPCIIVEQKPGHAQRFELAETAAVDWLVGLGARRRMEMLGDYVLSWE